MLADLVRATLRSSADAVLHTGRRAPLVGGLLGQNRELSLDGRVVFITGAARGLGAGDSPASPTRKGPTSQCWDTEPHRAPPSTHSGNSIPQLGAHQRVPARPARKIAR